MSTEKVSLTLDRKMLRLARQAVGPRGLSAYVDAALRLKLQQDRLRGLLDHLESKYGPVPQSVTEEVNREWPDEERRPRRPRRA